jgi:hypothetical protein
LHIFSQLIRTLDFYFLEAGESKVSKVLTGKKRKLRKADNSDHESSDDEARTTAIKNRKNKTQKTGVYDLWASTSNGV